MTEQQHPAVAHLTAALDRAETMARGATPGPWEAEGDDPTDDEVYTAHDGEHGDLYGQMVAFTRGPGSHANMLHIAAFNPAVVLRMVTADRQLLAQHQPIRGAGYSPDGSGYIGMTACTTCGTHDEYGIPWPCPTVLNRAKAWGWNDGTG